MRYIALDNNAAQIDLNNPVSVRITRDIDVPADALYAAFPIDSRINELKSIKVYSSDNLIFSGIIDEQKIECSDNGCLLKISSRSLAALLIDNEALSQNYEKTSLKVIFDRHIRPYGFTDYIGSEESFADKFIVYKGMSEWDVLNSFCHKFLGVHPRVINNTAIDATGVFSNSKKIDISNDFGIKYNNISYLIKRYNRLSEVFIRAKNDASYDVRAYDQSALDSGISRKRYLNAFNDVRTPVSFGDDMIKHAKFNSYMIKARCIGNVDAAIGSYVNLYDPIIGEMQNLVISKINYSLHSSGEFTEISMHRSE
mgnify:CR=1 FL=1